jgi:ribose 5-phosphate isomerase A
MVLGLGTDSTTSNIIDMLGEKLGLNELHNNMGVPTSQATAERAKRLGIPLTTLSEHYRLDLAVDGADENDGDLNLIKGLGRALLREKIVEMHAEQFIVIVDESKVVTRLGSRGPLPVEIVQIEADTHARWLNSLGCRANLWLEDDGRPVVTENGNYLVRCWFDRGTQIGIEDPYELARVLNQRPGIVEHGLFLDMASQVVVAGADGVWVHKKNRKN